MTDTIKPSSKPNPLLRRERERRAWSQQDLADAVGTTPLNVSRWERGVTSPNPYFRQKLSEVFEKTPQELGLVTQLVTGDSAPSTAVNSGSSTPPSALVEPERIWNVPFRRNPFFTGREEVLARLRDALLEKQQPVALAQPQAISGLGGIGKTQTAIEYANRYREAYQAVFWARAESRDLLISDFLTIASLLNLPQRNDKEQDVIVQAVLRWLDTHDDWLLVLDNADDLEVASEFFPSGSAGHVLLTTRSHSLGTLAQRIDLEKMRLVEGTIFLLRRVKRLKDHVSLESIPETVRAQAQAIVEALDGLPLALDQAGAYIEETGCSLSDYLKYYKTRQRRLLRTRGRDASGHPEPVATTWSLAFEKVEEANPAAAELLRLCAFLHPDEIPERMIIEGVSVLGPVLQSAAGDEMEWNEAIGELRRYSLVKRDPEEKILNIHRLVQAVVKGGMDEEMQRQWANGVVRVVNKAYPEVKFEAWPLCQLYLPHVQICVELIEFWKIKTLEAMRLLYEVSSYLAERSQLADAESLCLHALSMREELQGPNDLEVAKHLHVLADIYYKSGKYAQMKSIVERALEIQESKLDLMHPDLAESLNNLAAYYQLQGQNEQAESLLVRALSIREQALGPEHPDLAGILGNLAAVYRDQRKYEDAEPIFRRALKIEENIQGPDSPHLAILLSNYGGLFNEQKKYKEAEPIFRRALAIKEKILGPEHPQVALDLNNLAMCYYSHGDYEQAEILLVKTLEITENNLGPEHPDTARSLKNLAKLHTAQGKYEEAESLYQRALVLREKIFGQSHPLVILALKDFAELYRKMGHDAEAEEMEARAQAIRANT